MSECLQDTLAYIGQITLMSSRSEYEQNIGQKMT